jgi:para-nitrobenzyl esterase
VLFFIHGGAFAHGTGSESVYNGAQLARDGNAVVVTVNYRLGLLGFADFTELDADGIYGFSGNCGLQDVLAALKWVKEHIQHFGGDGGNITVIGQSAGGTMTAVLAAIPAAGPYVYRGVMMSGGPTQLQGKDDCIRFTREFLQYAGIDRAEQLLEKSLSDLMKLQKGFVAECGLGSAAFRLAVDGELIPEYPIPAAVQAAEGSGSSLDSSNPPIPLLIGTTQEEMSFMQFRFLEQAIDVERIMQDGLKLESPEASERLIQGYRDVYGEQHGRVMLYTDLLFSISSVWLAEAFSRGRENPPVWMYRFDYETAILKINGLKAFHATDLPFLFGTFDSILAKPLFLLDRDMEKVRQVSQMMQQDVLQFARTGTLPWEPCSRGKTPAKCYDMPPSVHPCVPEEIKQLYDGTAYKRRSFTPGTNPAPRN